MTTHPILDYLQGTSWDPQNSSSELHAEEDIRTQVRSKMKTWFVFFFFLFNFFFLGILLYLSKEGNLKWVSLSMHRGGKKASKVSSAGLLS